VLAGWPKGQPPAWQVFTFANPDIWFQAEAENYNRLMGENRRLELLQRGAPLPAPTARFPGRIE